MKKFFLLLTVFLFLNIMPLMLFAIQEEQSISMEKLEQEADLRQQELLSQKDQECLMLLEQQKPTLPDIFLVGILLITATTSAYLVTKFLQTRTYLSKHRVYSLFKDKFDEMKLAVDARNEEIDVLKMTIEKMKSISSDNDSNNISFDDDENDFDSYTDKNSESKQIYSVENDELLNKITRLEKEKIALEAQSIHDIDLIKEENLQIKQELEEAQTEKIEFLEMIESLQKQISMLESKTGRPAKPVDEKEIASIIENSASLSQEDLNSLLDKKKPEKSEPFSGIIDQDFMNKLIEESQTSNNQPAAPKKDKPLKPKPENIDIAPPLEATASLISQDDLDKMLDSAPSPETQKDINTEPATISQDDLDKMFDSTSASTISQEDLDKMFDSDSSTVTQDDLDKMFANTPSTPMSQDDLDKMFGSDSSTVSQDDLDKMFDMPKSNEALSQPDLDTVLSGGSTNEQKIKKQSKEEEPSSSLSQDQLNALLDESMTKSKETISKPVAMSQDDLDALFNQSTTFDSPFDSTEEKENENNKEEENSSGVLSQEDIEKLLGG